MVRKKKVKKPSAKVIAQFWADKAKRGTYTPMRDDQKQGDTTK